MMTNPSSSPAVADPMDLRRRRLLFLGAAIAAIAIGWTGYRWLSNGNSRSTDDAYVNGHVVAITPQVAGAVIRIAADNADRVVAGTPLVEIDPTDGKVELAAAEAQLAQAVRGVRGLYANDARLRADMRGRQADIDKARADLDKARADFRQRQSIAGTGAVTDEDVRHAADAVHMAEAALASAEAALSSTEQARAQALAQIDGAGAVLSTHPAVQAAAQRVRAAVLAIARTQVLSPVSGMVVQRLVQLGRRVGPGDRLMAVVPLDRLWIDANFKEVQLDGICPGQPATVTADIYGRHVTYHGRVGDIEAGSGAAFALLPAQNATGNWIKVVQRVPVRIQLDPGELTAHPLRVGLSAKVTVDTAHCESKAPAAPAQMEDMTLYTAQAKQADAAVAQVIAETMGQPE